MDVPKYLQILWSYKWLLLVGLVFAVIAAFLAGYTMRDGAIVSRATSTYSASTTVLVGSDNQPLFQAEIPGQPIEQGTTAPVQQDLTSTAVVYAYLISGTEVQTAVEAIIGEFAEEETLTAVRRTTQPGGNEQFPGRLSLPILDVVGVSADPIAGRGDLPNREYRVPEPRGRRTGRREPGARAAGAVDHRQRERRGRGRGVEPRHPDRRHRPRRIPRLRRARVRAVQREARPPEAGAPYRRCREVASVGRCVRRARRGPSAIDTETLPEALPSGDDGDRVPALAGRGRTD